MTIEMLKEKLQKYLDMKKELECKDYLKEIEDEVEAYRVKLLDKYAKENAEDLKKVCHYIELIQELLSEEKEEEVEVEQSEQIEEDRPVEEPEQQEESVDAAEPCGDEAPCEAPCDSHTPFGSLFSR